MDNKLKIQVENKLKEGIELEEIFEEMHKGIWQVMIMAFSGDPLGEEGADDSAEIAEDLVEEMFPEILDKIKSSVEDLKLSKEMGVDGNNKTVPIH